jgi:DNA replication protein DnaC
MRARGIDAARQRAAAKAERLQAKLDRTVPERYRNARVTEQSCRAWVDGYIAGDRRNLLLFGGVGTTKTTQAYAIFKELMEAGVNCSFDTPSGHLRRVKRAYDGDFSEDEVMDQLQSVPVLFIDDLGKESPTQWAVERMFDIVDERAARMKPVVVTTNLHSGELEARYGEAGSAFVSRLCGNGAVAVRFDGPDRRFG